MVLFTGLDDIDWSALEHAYGPATEVPDLLRGLVSDDPAVREWALDGMHGAVHHQESVYDSTVAAIPFLLELVGHAGLPGRADVVELLASIGDFDEEDAEDEAHEFGDVERQAVEAVTAAFPLFLNVLGDPDPAVRRATCGALLVCRAEAARVVDALSERLLVETDADVQTAIVKAFGTLGVRASSGRLSERYLAARLTDLVADHPDSTVRVAALTELARCAPDALPSDLVTVALDVLTKVYVEGTPGPEAAGFSTPTLLGALRERAEQQAAGRRAPKAFPLLAGLSRALDDRVEDRTTLLVRLLEAADWEQRLDAVGVARTLVENWRGDHRDLVRLIGDQLLAPEPRLPSAAATALQHLHGVAEPAADALARSIDAAPREAAHTSEDGPPAWITLWPSSLPSTGPTLRALAALGDPRALAPVRWALERPEPPSDIGHVVRALGPSAAEFVPLIRTRLRDLPVPEGHDSRRSGLITALGGLGKAAVPAVPDIVERLPDFSALHALGALGPHAAEAAPALRALLDHDESSVAIPAAMALWRVEGDADRVLSVLLRHIDDRVEAVEAIAELGQAAAAHVPALRALLHKPDPNGWLRLHVAEALWRATGDADAALPLLTSAWADNVYVRPPAARCLADMGPAAEPAAPLLREELARRRRHGSQDDRWSSDLVRADEELVRVCKDALAAIGTR
ncbi:hypothetical protein ALI22I_07210 [Saccharothrix sp. ALI-22-I]|uniref:HEAT repeat domain-containing protein n=1 Tax=Saccharothrix sp. ALI-22-I TaxID=1933778 RepID=UPI00097C8594|nr:HEAT repeat domain-containing protein [Saccharothrix sp. ALI-22-I]ONI91852.1 hypothetical protein ALI22I_07210 [Saccharothrix sp. ALI-22-I]